MKTVVVSTFPACGKTHAFVELNKMGWEVLDSDSSNFSWSFDGAGNKIRHPLFPQNYIEHIKSNIGKVDIIFVSSHKEVRDALEKAEINYVMVYPDKTTMKNEWIGRCYTRGSGVKFCDMLNENWDLWIDELIRENMTSNCRVGTCILNRENPFLLARVGFIQNCIGNYNN